MKYRTSVSLAQNTLEPATVQVIPAEAVVDVASGSGEALVAEFQAQWAASTSRRRSALIYLMPFRLL
jgi:hypothetical protein